MLASRTVGFSTGEQSETSGKKLWWNFDFLKRFSGFWQQFKDIYSNNRLLGLIVFLPLMLLAISLFIFDLMWFLFSTFFKVIMAAITWLLRIIRYVSSITIVPLLDWSLEKVNNWIHHISHDTYPAFLRRVLKNPGQVTAMVFVPALVLGFYIFTNMGATLIPEVHQGEFNVDVMLPVGTPVEKTGEKMASLEKFLLNTDLVAKVATVAGTDKSASSVADEGENTAKVTVRLKPTGNNELAEETVIAKVRDFLQDVPGVQFKISRPVLFSFKSPVEIQIKGYNLKDLKIYTDLVRDELKNIDEIRDVKSSLQAGNPEIQIKFNRARVAAYGLNVQEAAGIVRTKVRGDVATEFKDRDRKIDIRVKVTDEDKGSVAALKRLRINRQGAIAIPLEAVASIILDEGPSQIRRESQQRSALITANLSPGISLTEASDEIIKVLENFKFPPELYYEISGQNKEMETSMNSLYLALGLAIFLVYIVMASQFESFVHPLVIIFTIPLAFLGAIIFLYLFGIPLSVMVFLGLIMLAGIVVNNAIVLVDYINQLRERGEDRVTSIVNAGSARLRPILMTTLTTVLGLLPMAIGLGDGSEIRAPMALTVIAGLSVSTLLTLVVIPTVYLLFDKKEVNPDGI